MVKISTIRDKLRLPFSRKSSKSSKKRETVTTDSKTATDEATFDFDAAIAHSQAEGDGTSHSQVEGDGTSHSQVEADGIYVVQPAKMTALPAPDPSIFISKSDPKANSPEDEDTAISDVTDSSLRGVYYKYFSEIKDAVTGKAVTGKTELVKLYYMNKYENDISNRTQRTKIFLPAQFTDAAVGGETLAEGSDGNDSDVRKKRSVPLVCLMPRELRLTGQTKVVKREPADPSKLPSYLEIYESEDHRMCP